MGSWNSPEIQVFCNAGRGWRDWPSNMEPARESERACKPELKDRGELSGIHSSHTHFPRAETAPQITRQREQESSDQPLQCRNVLW